MTLHNIIYEAIGEVCNTDEPRKFAQMNETIYKVAERAVMKYIDQCNGVTLEGWVHSITRGERGDTIELWLQRFALDPVIEAFGGPEAFMKRGFDINMRTHFEGSNERWPILMFDFTKREEEK